MRGAFIDPPVAEMATRYKAGESLGGLGHIYDVSKSTARNRLKDAGVTMRSRGAPPGNDHARKGRTRCDSAR